MAFTLGLMVAAMPAQAQLFWRSPDYRGTPVNGTEEGIVSILPGATPAEQQADVAWTLRAGLNVAALQCQFAPSLMTRENYNAILQHHAKELNDDYKVLGAYFDRVTPKSAGKGAGANALDRFNTHIYNSFSTLNAQYGFCQTASRIALDALLAPKGQFHLIATNRLMELRNSLKPVGDYLWAAQPPMTAGDMGVPDFPPDCFDHKGRLKKKCLEE